MRVNSCVPAVERQVVPVECEVWAVERRWGRNESDKLLAAEGRVLTVKRSRGWRSKQEGDGLQAMERRVRVA